MVTLPLDPSDPRIVKVIRCPKIVKDPQFWPAWDDSKAFVRDGCWIAQAVLKKGRFPEGSVIEYADSSLKRLARHCIYILSEEAE